MKLSLVSTALLAVVTLLHADNEIGFIEKFALAPDRSKVLGELIPGSEDFFFFHALHYQQTGQKPKLAEIMEQWKKRFPDSTQRTVIENRTALLGFETDPQATLKYLKRTLSPDFSHSRQADGQKPNLPAALDPAEIGRRVFVTNALSDDSLSPFTQAGLEQLVRDRVELRPAQRRSLLSKLQRPDLPGIVALVAAELRTQESRGFGEFPLHRALLPEQLDELARLVPSLLDQQPFLFARLRKMLPGSDADAEFDPVEREAWLERTWEYVRKLSPSQNSLKAAVLHRRLQHDRSRGIYDRARFLEYLKLPRPAGYANPSYYQQPALRQQAVDLNFNPAAVSVDLRAIGNDEPLVREFLLRLLAEEPTWEPWAVWLRAEWLKPIFAEAKITGGMGNPEQWASLLTPSQFQQLKERVDIDFAPGSAPFLAPQDEVKLALILKNTPKLIVKIYEINALNFFLAEKRQLNTDLSLDGLVPNVERTHAFDDVAGSSPFRRASREFTFPELKGKRGAWVVEFIGGGRSSRALIRKGQWHVISQAGPAGDVLSVLDENQEPVKDAAVWLDGRRLATDEKTGRITVPFTAQPGRKSIVLTDATDGFATLTSFLHHGESYRLDAHFHLEREQLLSRRTATLGMRTTLLVHETPVPLDLIDDAKLTIISTTIDGVSTTTEVKPLKLSPEKVFTHPLAVPDRFATLSVTLSGSVKQLVKGGERFPVSASASWDVNGIDKTDRTDDLLLSAFGKDGYVFELLGKNGEPLADRQILFEFEHRDVKWPVKIALRTDERARVQLGALEEISAVTATAPDGRVRRWPLVVLQRSAPTVMHATAGEALRVPFSGAKAPVSLLESRGGTPVRDWSNAVAFVPGFLELKGLAPGDYSLQVGGEDGRSVAIRVTAGKAARGWLLGEHRHLDGGTPAPAQIESVVNDANAVTVKLANVNRFTRLHVAASRFLPDRDMFESLGQFARFAPGAARPAKLPNLYTAGREIGDEYRYILERRYAKLFPGNMLTRPGLILNPWEKRSTDLESITTAAGHAAASTSGERRGVNADSPAEPLSRAKKLAEGQREPLPSSSLDFLAAPAPVLWNLVPDKDGIVRIDRKALGDRQYVQLYAEDLASAVWQAIPLPEAPTKFEDQRLARNLDPQQPFSEQKKVTVLGNGQSLTLTDIRTSDLETYDTLGGVFSLFTTLSGNPTLAEFAWVLEWPKLKEEEKRAKYSEHACHELSFFLSRKDRPFFEKVVQPYLRNKKDRTFMDDYLLGNELKRYLEPWHYSRLNVVERCLLSQRIAGEAPATARHLRELWELLPPDAERQNILFETALRGRSLDESDRSGGFKGEKAALGLEAERTSRGELAVRSVSAAAAAPAPASPVELSKAMPEPRALGTAVKGAGPAGGEADGDKRADDVAALSNREWKAQSAAEIESAIAGREAGEKDLFLNVAGVAEARALMRAYFRQLGPTKEWAENNYYKLPIVEQNEHLVPINAFWRDYAAWDGRTPFLSAHVAEATRNFTEMMLALAVLDLPFDVPQHTMKTDGPAYTLTAAAPLIAFHKEIKPTTVADKATELLVSQNFFRRDARFRMEGNERFDEYVSEEFLAGVVYGANIVVTNPTSAPLKLALLLQIPQGALPVAGSKPTDSPRLELAAYTTRTFEYFFYFPTANQAGRTFEHYPVNVARAEQVVGRAKPFAFKVVAVPSRVDRNSWEYVSQHDGPGEVIRYLESHNIERIDLERVAWRARESLPFYRQLVSLLQQRHVYADAIYRYSLYHGDAATLPEWMRHQDAFLAACGAWLDSKLAKIDPIERRSYEHLEYSPLVNQRAHRIGGENRIANPVLREQYQSLLRILAHKPALDAMDQMSVTYYLLLQDRLEEGLARFRSIDPAQLPTRLQHDYLRCYTAFYEQQLPEARGIAAQYSAYPVDRWRALFAEVTAQLDEIEGKGKPEDATKRDREAQQAALSATEPAFHFTVEDRTIHLTWSNLPAATINFYLIDPEFSFTSNPFVTEDATRFAVVKPAKTVTQKLPADTDTLDVRVPDEFARANVLVEVVAAGQRKAQTYHANTLKLALAENYGRLELRDRATAKPISRAYVKVYARLGNGTVRFFKDGYTDLRGKFDYASLNSSETATPAPPSPPPAIRAGALDHQMLRPDELGSVEKLAVLVLSEANGAAVREVSPPSE